jgi:hypothetical protein
VVALARRELLGVDSKARHSAPMMPGPARADTSHVPQRDPNATTTDRRAPAAS